MIIAATRIRTTSGHQKLAGHVWRGAGNAAVSTPQGSEADLADMMAMARHAGRRHAIRHYHISPGEPLTHAEALVILAALAAEFGFDAEATVLVRHQKARRVAYDTMLGTQGYEQHWHAMAPEVDPVTLQALDSRWMHPRHERLAREAEVRLLHKVIKGRWNASVIAALEQRSAPDIARLLVQAGIDDGPPAYAAYTSAQRRRLERQHADPQGEALDVPALVRQLQNLWAAHSVDRPKLDRALRRHGLRLRHPDAPPPPPHSEYGRAIAPAPVTRATGWVVDGWDGRSRQAYVLGALHRLVREPRPRVEAALRARRPATTLQANAAVDVSLAPDKSGVSSPGAADIFADAPAKTDVEPNPLNSKPTTP